MEAIIKPAILMAFIIPAAFASPPSPGSECRASCEPTRLECRANCIQRADAPHRSSSDRNAMRACMHPCERSAKACRASCNERRERERR